MKKKTNCFFVNDLAKGLYSTAVQRGFFSCWTEKVDYTVHDTIRTIVDLYAWIIFDLNFILLIYFKINICVNSCYRRKYFFGIATLILELETNVYHKRHISKPYYFIDEFEFLLEGTIV